MLLAHFVYFLCPFISFLSYFRVISAHLCFISVSFLLVFVPFYTHFPLIFRPFSSFSDTFTSFSVELPDEDARRDILSLLLQDETLSDVTVADVARMTPRYSGSDLKNFCIAAAYGAVRQELAAGGDATARVLRREHFDRAAIEVKASVSDDAQSLSLLRKWDQQYGDRMQVKAAAAAFGF